MKVSVPVAIDAALLLHGGRGNGSARSGAYDLHRRKPDDDDGGIRAPGLFSGREEPLSSPLLRWRGLPEGIPFDPDDPEPAENS